jgi:hypothetical protein
MNITEIDKHNLMDVLHMGLDQDTIILNKLDKWYDDFLDRLELHCCPEITPKATNTNHIQNSPKAEKLVEASTHNGATQMNETANGVAVDNASPTYSDKSPLRNPKQDLVTPNDGGHNTFAQNNINNSENKINEENQSPNSTDSR